MNLNFSILAPRIALVVLHQTTVLRMVRHRGLLDAELAVQCSDDGHLPSIPLVLGERKACCLAFQRGLASFLYDARPWVPGDLDIL